MFLKKETLATRIHWFNSNSNHVDTFVALGSVGDMKDNSAKAREWGSREGRRGKVQSTDKNRDENERGWRYSQGGSKMLIPDKRIREKSELTKICVAPFPPVPNFKAHSVFLSFPVLFISILFLYRFIFWSCIYASFVNSTRELYCIIIPVLSSSTFFAFKHFFYLNILLFSNFFNPHSMQKYFTQKPA